MVQLPAVLNSKPAEWFKDEHVPILMQYVRHVETADILSRAIDAFDTARLGDDEGLRQYEKLTSMRSREAGVIHNLARSMRLTQLAIYQSTKEATMDNKSASRKPWQSSNDEVK
jgi:hypothetical protein